MIREAIEEVKKQPSWQQQAQDLRMEMYKFLKKKYKKMYTYYSDDFDVQETIKFNKEANILVNHDELLFDFEWTY